MANVNHKKEAEWAEAKKLCRLNGETIKMAKEMGLNPRSLIKNIPGPKQLWKAPVHLWIREIYEERQEKAKKTALKKANVIKPSNTPDSTVKGE